jgi:hypothetical protein
MAIAALAVFVSSCGSDDPMSPYNPEIANNPNNFEFQITDAANLDHREDYVWTNTGAAATIDQSCAITGGNAVVTLMDSTGATLYTANLADNGTFQSSDGVVGSWTIRVTFTNLDGTVNFRVQKL